MLKLQTLCEVNLFNGVYSLTLKLKHCFMYMYVCLFDLLFNDPMTRYGHVETSPSFNATSIKDLECDVIRSDDTSVYSY